MCRMISWIQYCNNSSRAEAAWHKTQWNGRQRRVLRSMETPSRKSWPISSPTLNFSISFFPALFDRLHFQERNYFLKGHPLFSLQMCFGTQMQDRSAQE